MPLMPRGTMIRALERQELVDRLERRGVPRRQAELRPARPVRCDVLDHGGQARHLRRTRDRLRVNQERRREVAAAELIRDLAPVGPDGPHAGGVAGTRTFEDDPSTARKRLEHMG